MPKTAKEKMSDSPMMEEEKMSESYLSIGLGLLVVLIVGVLLWNFLSSRNKQKSSDIAQEGAQQKQEEQAAPPSEQTTGSYTVQNGDTLWSISEKYYGNGYEWERIAQENNIANPNALEEGQKLVLPTVQKTLPATGLSDGTYIVEAGDTLWSISCTVYSDCYRWSEIATANNLNQNPGVIEIGQALQIP